jgi:hypothetical protein
MAAFAFARVVRWRTMMLLATAFLSADALRVTGSGQVQGGDHETFPLTPPKRYVTDVATSEDMQSVVQKSLKSTFIEGLHNLDWERTARGLSEDFRGRFPRPAEGRAVDDDLLLIRQYEAAGLEMVDRGGFLDALRAHVGSWTSIERASWQMFEFLLEPNRERAFAKAHFELGGPNPGGERSAVNATVAVSVVRSPSGEWRIRRFDLVEGMRVDNPMPPLFRDITDAAGLHFNRSEADRQSRQEILDNRASLIDSAVSIVDWNHDGFWDILVTEGLNHSVLFLNDGKGGFVRGTLPIQDRRLFPSQFLFVDLDGDGLEELVSNRVSYLGNHAWMGIYTRRNGKWVFLPHALEFENPPGLIRSDAQSITAADVNGDGLIDLFVAGYDNNRSGDPARFNLVDAHDGDRNLLFINHGELRFTEESEKRGLTGTRYTYVAQFFDFDGDGDLDLFEGHDYAPNTLWENKGDGTFRALKDHPFARDLKFTMGLTIGDWNNTGNWSVYVSNMYSHAGNRVVRLAESASEKTRALLKVAAQGNQLFTMKSGTWQNDAVQLGVNEAGWAWGSLFVDIDNDGDKEIFVTNGNTSYRDPDAPDF